MGFGSTAVMVHWRRKVFPTRRGRRRPAGRHPGGSRGRRFRVAREQLEATNVRVKRAEADRADAGLSAERARENALRERLDAQAGDLSLRWIDPGRGQGALASARAASSAILSSATPASAPRSTL